MFRYGRSRIRPPFYITGGALAGNSSLRKELQETVQDAPMISGYKRRENFMRKLKQFSLALAVVCALSTACGQSGSTETTAASAETTAETTAETERRGKHQAETHRVVRCRAAAVLRLPVRALPLP